MYIIDSQNSMSLPAWRICASVSLHTFSCSLLLMNDAKSLLGKMRLMLRGILLMGSIGPLYVKSCLRTC